MPRPRVPSASTERLRPLQSHLSQCRLHVQAVGSAMFEPWGAMM